MTPARWVAAALALLFGLAAAVQWNDPDPLPWMAAHATTAGLALAHALGRRAPVWLCVGLGLVLAGFALSLTPSLLDADAGAYTSIAMQDDTAEEARESIGLWLAAATLAWLAHRGRQRPAAG